MTLLATEKLQSCQGLNNEETNTEMSLAPTLHEPDDVDGEEVGEAPVAPVVPVAEVEA